MLNVIEGQVVEALAVVVAFFVTETDDWPELVDWQWTVVPAVAVRSFVRVIDVHVA